jgi:hypothetical protein
MKPLLLSFCLLLTGCAASIDGAFPAEAENLQIPLGAFQLSNTTLAQVPYFGRSQVVFKDQEGYDIFMQITEPAYSPQIKLKQTFPDPNAANLSVDYTYTGERYGIQLQGLETGTIIDIEVLPRICEDPKLQEDGIIEEQIRIGLIGFYPYEFTQFLNPLMQVSTDDQVVCVQRPAVTSRRLGQLELRDRVFEDVFYTNTIYGNYDIEVFYNTDWGVVAVRVNDLEWVVDRW